MSNRRLTPNQLKTNRRRLTNHARTIVAAMLLSGGILSSEMIAWANGPAPGTVIENQATGSFVDPSDNSTNLIESNVVQVTVAEVAGITVTNNGFTEPDDGTVNTGDTVYFDFVITNVGNDPTQFVIPGSASITNGTQAGDIQIIAYDADGSGAGAAVDLSGSNITVPGGGDNTGNLLNGVVNTNNGSVPSAGSITVRVPVTAGASGLDLTVTLGDTAVADGQNEAYVAGTNDVYTQDNSGTTNDDTDGAPINNEREASDSLTVAIATATLVTTNVSEPSLCVNQGGTLGTTNLFTAVSNGDFGTSANDDPDVIVDPNPFPSVLRDPPFTYRTGLDFDGETFPAVQVRSNGVFRPFVTIGHTGIIDPDNGPTGRFLLVDGSDVGGEFFTETISGLQTNTNYEFSLWIANILDLDLENNVPATLADPNVSLRVDGISGYTSGLIPKTSEMEWRRIGFVFNTGSRTSVTFSIQDITGEEDGNDFVIDNATAIECTLPTGNIAGTVYTDNNAQNDTFDSGAESGLGLIKLDLIDTRGTPATDDDIIVSTQDSGVDGTYSFVNVPLSSNYIVRVDTADSDLPGIITGLGTTNDLAVTLNTNGQSVTGQDFGFDNSAVAAVEDYGDAPDSYGTTSANNGPTHVIVSGIHLGTAPDSESDAMTPLDGSGDGAEDDGITLTTLTEGDSSYTIPAGNITATGTGTLHAWLDFDKSGTFEPGEYTSVVVNSGTSAGDLSWSGITAGAAGDTYARFRFTLDASINANTSGGAASDGEVEDYVVAIAASSFNISGTLYVDSNTNDIFENPASGGSEAPMPENITVRLISSDGSTELATTVTDTNGVYSFPNLASGTYQVTVETTDPDIPIGHNLGTTSPLIISLTNSDATDQNFGFDLITTGGEVTFCQSPNGEVYSGGISNDIYAIYPPTGATFRLTNTALAGVVNSLATDHFYRVVYYAEGQAIYAWDPVNDSHFRLRDSNGNLNVSAMPGGGSISSLTSGGAAFYNGSYYVGIERAQGNSNTEVYRVDFVPGSNGLVIQSLTALGVNDNTGGANGALNNADWGDMIISDAGIIYGATRRAGFTWSFDLSTSIYNQISGNYLGQLAKDGDGTLWGLSDTSRIQQVNINTGALFGPSSPTSSPIADMAECVVGLSTVGDRIWDDLDGDGVQDPLEPGIANVTVGIYRDLNGNGVIDTTGAINFQDPLLTTQVTNSSGNYDFVDLIQGNYIVKVLEGTADDLDGTNVLDGAVLTTTATTPGGQQAVTVPLGINDYDDADFGYQLPIIPQNPNVLLVKRITQINGSNASAGGDDLAGYINQDDVTNPYDDNDITVADPVNPTDPPKDTDQWPDPSTNLIGGIDGGNVMPNDEIEYTIYYLSSGDATAESVLFCDYVPTFTSFIANGYNGSAPQATGGIGGADLSIELFLNGSTDYHTGANDGDSATYFSPGNDPATSFPGIDCDGDGDGINANTNGAVVVNLGDLPDATTNAAGAYGYVRFRTRVK